MSRSPQVFSLLKEVLPIEIARIITSIYIISWQRFKPGQLVFDAPCGHLLRYIKEYRTETFICPVSKEVCAFDKEIYERWKWQCSAADLWNLIETTMDSEWDDVRNM